MFVSPRWPALLATVFALVGPAAAAPLDLTDTSSRPVEIAVENSSELAVVGQGFGPGFPATYSVTGGVGTVLVSPETHALMRTGFLQPVPGSFTSLAIEVDLTTLQAISQTASGAFASGPLTSGFTQHPLASDAVLGFVGPSLPPLACPSQSAVDDACLIVPAFCGETCTLVAGAAYEPSTGEVNLVGVETQAGCDGSLCFGPFDYFTGQGDLRLTEAPVVAPVPALSYGAMVALVLLLAGTSWGRVPLASALGRGVR
jgi:hypothetical protein